MITMSSNSQLKSILYIYVPQVHLVFNICIDFFCIQEVCGQFKMHFIQSFIDLTVFEKNKERWY